MKRIIALLFVILLMAVQVCYAAPASEETAVNEDLVAIPEQEPEEDTAAGKDNFPFIQGDVSLFDSIISMLLSLPAGRLMEYVLGPDVEHLSVGNPNQLDGHFFTNMWGNSTSDQDVRSLLHSYNLIRWDSGNGMFVHDPTIVTDITVTDNAAGDRTFTLTLADDLFYSDGTPITARDYAFSILVQIAPEIADLGGIPARKPQFVGYQEYVDGESDVLAGVHVTGDHTIVFTVSNEYLPFFYEMALLTCLPYPASVIAPGVEVRDDGAGVYLANIDDTIEEPIFTAELLQETIMDPETGYLSHPSLVSGPYTLVSWDGEVAEFEINEYYKGNIDGELPRIKTITFKTADNNTMIEELKKGEYDLLNKVMSNETINEGMELVSNRTLQNYFGMSNYPRMGMSYITFDCDSLALSDKDVRQAIAWCMDRDKITADYTNYYGIRVDGYYGVGQWLYGIINGTILPPIEEPEEGDAKAQAEYEKQLEEFENLNLDDLTVYNVDLERAENLLERAGWKLNEDGIREKTFIVDESDPENIVVYEKPAGETVLQEGQREEVVTQELTLIYPEGNTIDKSLEKFFIPNLEKIGIKLELVPMSFHDLLTQFYYPEYREADMIYLASNFDLIFDPSTYFKTETEEETGEEIHTWVTTNCEDEELYNAAVAMRETEPGDVLNYCKHWVEFQKRFNELLPMLPIYSNIYFDFYVKYLHDYPISENINWSDAILYSYLSRAKEKTEEPEEESSEEELGEGMVEFDD